MATEVLEGPENPDNIMEFETPEADTFKILTEALKDMFTDAHMIFHPGGVKIEFMDAFELMLIYLKLEEDKFARFYCKDNLVVGVNMNTLAMILYTITKDNILEMAISNNDRDNLNIMITDSKRSVRYRSKLQLLDLDVDKFEMPESEFDVSLNMPSDLFKKICTDMKKFTDLIEIKNIGNQLIFTGVNDQLTKSIIVGESDGNLEVEERPDEDMIIQGYFNLKRLCMFTKCANLSDSVRLYLRNDFPMIIEYDVGSLGVLKVMLVHTDPTDPEYAS